MTDDTTDDYRQTWQEYKKNLDQLADRIEAAVLEQGGGTLNGRDWCVEEAVPEVMFAHAVEHGTDRLEWGVSPMHPWVIDGE